ncbi:DevC protein [Candidatus Methylobacter favarea]|uniref:DevC protein n=1 Tax=Candidatus Methylobacter favarea TaxID=2707345 RepID=A0A8S0X9M3_9GAMM|nr:ABC transporter permease DevC [Candidatus Methylobacter favarea]CAA9892446.1 DevC protein [Candidatus Methylobacter favarea]
MSLLVIFVFPARLAWRQLIHDRTKLIAAICGVLFATVLVFMQMGFKDALYAGASSSPTKMNGDLFIMHKQTEAMWRSVLFDRSELMRALGHPQVVSAYPMYIGLAQFKDAVTQTKRTLMVYGYDTDTNLMNIDEVRDKQEQLHLKDTILFDESSRPEFGPMRKLISEGRNINEINDHKVKVVGLFRLGISFSADANVITSDLNFLRIFPERISEKINLGIIKLVPGADKEKVKSELIAKLNKDINFFTFDELVESEKFYWQTRTPIGFIFGFGTVMGLVVGMVIVYQILFTDITNHLNEFATLKAMGYRTGYFIRVVFASAFFLAILGFIPGYIVSVGLYRLAEGQIYMPMPMTLDKIFTIFVFILTMCATAGILAMRKLGAANPADMF